VLSGHGVRCLPKPVSEENKQSEQSKVNVISKLNHDREEHSQSSEGNDLCEISKFDRQQSTASTGTHILENAGQKVQVDCSWLQQPLTL